MNLTNRELSEKLVALGCVSKSGFSWMIHTQGLCDPFILYWEMRESGLGPNERVVPAFSLCDFVGMGERQVENRKKIWGDKYVCTACGKKCPPAKRILRVLFASSCGGQYLPAQEYHHHAMIKSKNPLKYLEDHLKEGE